MTTQHQQDALEILDVVDQHDSVIGTIRRGEIARLTQATQPPYIRFVEAFIQRPNGDVWLPRRSLGKSIAPGGLDLSVAGHVLAGESYEHACIREAAEEAGLRPTHHSLQLIRRFSPRPDAPYFRHLYLIQTTQEPTLSNEHTEASWVRPQDLESVLRHDVPTKDTFYEDIPALLEYLAIQRLADKV